MAAARRREGEDPEGSEWGSSHEGRGHPGQRPSVQPLCMTQLGVTLLRLLVSPALSLQSLLCSVVLASAQGGICLPIFFCSLSRRKGIRLPIFTPAGSSWSPIVSSMLSFYETKIQKIFMDPEKPDPVGSFVWVVL